MSFGKHSAKIYAENETGIKFRDVAGEDEAKESLEEIVDLLQDVYKRQPPVSDSLRWLLNSASSRLGSQKDLSGIHLPQ